MNDLTQKENDIVIHDSLNTINVILGNIEIALGTEDIVKLKFRLNKAIDGIQKLTKYLKSSLMAASEAMYYPKEEVHLRKAIGEINDAGFKFGLAIYGEAIWAVNRDHLDRTIVNLFKNSMEADASNLTITMSKRYITFKDDGKSFPREVLAAFAKGKSCTTKLCGFGLGLQSLASFAKKNRLIVSISNNNTGGANIRFERS